MEPEIEFENGTVVIICVEGEWNKAKIKERVSKTKFKVIMGKKLQVVDFAKNECCENAWLR